jgi:hypothetical protein
MDDRRLLAGAIALLGLGLLANAAVMVLRPGATAPPLPFPEAAAQSGFRGSIMEVRGRGQFITTSAEGNRVYLWFYWENPEPGKSTLEFVKMASAQ